MRIVQKFWPKRYNRVLGTPTATNTVHQIAISLLALSAVYLPMLTHLYDYHDAFYHYRLESGCHTHPQWIWMFALGRPLYNFLECNVTEAIIKTPFDAIKLRAIGLILLAASSVHIFRLLRNRKIEPVFSFLFATSLLCLPGFLLWMNMTSDTANLFAVPLTLFAATTLTYKYPIRNFFFADWATRISGSALLLLTGMLIYQQIVPFFFVIITITIVFESNRTKGRHIIAMSIASFLIAGIIYLLIHSLVLAPYVHFLTDKSIAQRFPQTAEEMAIKFSPISATLDVLDNSPRVFALWWMNFTQYGWIFSCALFLCASVYLARRQPGAADFGRFFALERLIWFIALLLLVNCLTLMSAEPNSPQRHSVPYEAFVVTIVALSLYMWRPMRFLSYLVLALGIGYSMWNVDRNMVLPNADEFHFIANRLEGYNPATHSPICAIPSKEILLSDFRTNAVDPKAEFGRTTSMFKSDLPHEILAVAETLNISKKTIGYAKIYGPNQKPPSSCFVIDMRKFQTQFLNLHEVNGND